MAHDKADGPKRLKITNQFRSKASLVYDLNCDGNRLTLRITGRQSAEDAGEWHVEARTSTAGAGPSLEAWGPTRRDALLVVAAQWKERAYELALPVFDWDAVAAALTEVRAL
jgi:hypothetical protein